MHQQHFKLRLTNDVVSGVSGCEAYIDDVILYSNSWDKYLETIKALFVHLSDAQLTIDLAKSEFGQGTVSYMGHVVGQGKVKPIDAKVKAICNFPIPQNKKQCDSLAWQVITENSAKTLLL